MYVFQGTVFCCFFSAWCKKITSFVFFVVIIYCKPIKMGTLDLFLCSDVTHHSIRNKHHDRTFTYVRISIHNTASHTNDLKLLPQFVAHVYI
jgi:hypothetical protein